MKTPYTSRGCLQWDARREEQWGGMLEFLEVRPWHSLEEMLRSWDTSSLKSHVWLVLLWHLGGFFFDLFRDWGYTTCHIFLMWQSFVASMHFCLTEKNMFSLILFSCLAKAIRFPWGIRLLWGQRKLNSPTLLFSWLLGRNVKWIKQVCAKGNPNNRSFLQCTALWPSATLKEFTLFLWSLPGQDTLPQQFEVHIPFHIWHTFSQKITPQEYIFPSIIFGLFEVTTFNSGQRCMT